MQSVSGDTRITDKVPGNGGNVLLTCCSPVPVGTLWEYAHGVVKFFKTSKEAEHSDFYVKSTI